MFNQESSQASDTALFLSRSKELRIREELQGEMHPRTQQVRTGLCACSWHLLSVFRVRTCRVPAARVAPPTVDGPEQREQCLRSRGSSGIDYIAHSGAQR